MGDISANRINSDGNDPAIVLLDIDIEKVAEKVGML